MIKSSTLRYTGTVAMMVGLGFLFLAILRGLPSSDYVSKVGLPGNYSLPLPVPPVWPPRNVWLAVYLAGSGEVDLLVFDKAGYDAFTASGSAAPLKEFKGLGSGVVSFEVPSRGEYYIVVRNRGSSPVDGDLVLTFWGFERDLLYLSAVLLILGTSLLLVGRILERARRVDGRS
mgnify:CR=1 FL=1